MERTAEKLRTQLGVPALFVSPPGMVYWGGMFQQFVYMPSEVCLARSIEFYLCAPNLHVGKADLRPAALSAQAYLAAISRLLQPVEKGGNAQLTSDDAIYYDYGMRLGTLTFDENRTRPEATLKEREIMRRYNWLVREAHPNTLKADLAAVWDQIGRRPLNREIERTIPMDLHGQPFRFPWTVDFIKKTINSSLDASPTVCSDYKFKFIKVPNRYWKEPVGYPRARPIARGQELLDHQLRHTDCANVPQWLSVAAQMRDRNLSRRMAPIQYEPVWRPQGRMTMSGDTPLTLLDIVNQVLGAEMRAEWDDECLHLEVTNFETWKKACALWKQSGWISKRVALAAHHRAEEKRAQRYAPTPSQSTAAPVMAMSLEQTLTVEAASMKPMIHYNIIL